MALMVVEMVGCLGLGYNWLTRCQTPGQTEGNRITAAAQYAAYQDAIAAQRARIYGQEPPVDSWRGSTARRFRFDPHRTLEPNLEVIASYVQPDDVVVDVGGGAGRVSLPLALRCREAVVVEPSPGMGEEFDASRLEAGIANARRVQSGWLDAEGVTGDVVFSADVAYFVRDIVPFVEKLEAAARRRVMITLWSVSPPNSYGPLFRLVYGEEQAPVPGFQQLMAVLWEMGVLPDLRMLPESPWWEGEVLSTKEEALRLAVEGSWLREEDRGLAREAFEKNFDQLFSSGADGFRPRWREASRELLITWETR